MIKRVRDYFYKKDFTFFILVIAAISTLFVRLYHITAPIANEVYHSFRNTETAIVIQNYLREGLSIFDYSMPLFGEPWTLMFEFPSYQIVIYFVMKIVGISSIDTAGRLVSIFSFYLCDFVLVKFAKKLVDDRGAYVVGIAFLLSAFNLYFSRAMLIDFFSVFLALIYVACVFELIQNEKKLLSLLVGLFFGILAYVTKATTLFPIVYFIMLVLINCEIPKIVEYEGTWYGKIGSYLKNNFSRLLLLVILLFVPVLFAKLWTNHADNMKELSIFTSWLSSRSSDMIAWNYGTLSQKISLSDWKVIVERYVNFWGGGFSFLGIILSYIFLSARRYCKIVIFSFVAQFATIITLFNLYLVHNYYLIGITPFVFLSMGLMLYEVFSSIPRDNAYMRKLEIIILCLVFGYLQIRVNDDYISGVVDIQSHKGNIGNYISQITTEDELILVADEDYNPSTLYSANRKGFMIRNSEWIDSNELYSLVSNDNYTTLLVHDILKANEFLSHESEVVEYAIPLNDSYFGARDSFVYKFGENIIGDDICKNAYVPRDDDEICINGINSYGILGLKYSIDSDKVVSIVAEGSNGDKQGSQITLLKDLGNIYIDVNSLLDNPVNVYLEQDSGVLEIKY